MQHLIDDLSEQVALLSADCSIVAVNRAWTEAMANYGYSGVAVGDNYRDKCKEIAAEGYDPAIRLLAALDDIVSGKTSFWQITFNGRGPWSSREYQMTFHRVSVEAEAFITVTRFDRTEMEELRRANEDVRKALSESQSAERQRLTRELHDSTSQLLVGTQLLFGSLKPKVDSPDVLAIIEEVQELVRDAQREIRSISYLSQPPALEKWSFTEAVERLLQGFGERSGLAASMRIEGDFEIDLPETRAGLYRVVQEALSNIIRHAHATNASVSMIARRDMTHIVIRDNGRGIKPTATTGVGLSGMRARLTELGGKLSIRALSPGTAIIASVGNGASFLR